MRAPGRWLVALLVLAVARRRAGRTPRHEDEPLSPRAELIVLALLALAALSAIAFVPIYALDSLRRIQTQLLGLSLGLAFAFLSAAMIVGAKKLVTQEQRSDRYPPEEHEAELEEMAQLGPALSRRRLLKLGGLGAGAALTAALVTPAASLGPLLDVSQLRRTVWRRGVRLVDSAGKVVAADALEVGSFVTAFPEGAPQDELDSPLVVVRLEPEALDLGPGRAGWAPNGIVAYSKVCTHAGCAVSLYRYPLYAPTSPRPALVCPCHYSTFDPASGGTVLSGPAGRDLPQLPLAVDAEGNLRAAGDFSGSVGPSWWGVRRGE